MDQCKRQKAAEKLIHFGSKTYFQIIPVTIAKFKFKTQTRCLNLEKELRKPHGELNYVNRVMVQRCHAN